MRGPEVLGLLQARLFLLVLVAGGCQYCFGSCTSPLAVLLAVLYVLYIALEAITIRAPSSPVPSPVTDPPGGGLELSRAVGELVDPRRELTQIAQQLDEMQGLLQSHGEWVEKTGTACLNAFRQIHKEQRSQLRQYAEFSQEYDEALGSVVNVLDDLRNENAEASQAAAQIHTSLYTSIGQYRQDIDTTQSAVQQHISSVNNIMVSQDRTMAAVRQYVTERTDAFETKLEDHARTAEENRRLVKDYGTSVNRVVSDHAQLVAEYQVVLDGIVSLNTANRVFSLVHIPCGWETLGDIAEEVEDPRGLLSAAQPATGSMVDNVQELSRTFRGISNQAIKATPSLMDQAMTDVFSKIQDTVEATVNAQRAEETGQLRKAQEDIEKLRADLGEIEEFRRVVREREELEREHKELEKRHQRQLELIQIIRNDPQRIRQDAELRAEVDEIMRYVEGRKRAAGVSSPGKPARAAGV